MAVYMTSPIYEILEVNRVTRTDYAKNLKVGDRFKLVMDYSYNRYDNRISSSEVHVYQILESDVKYLGSSSQNHVIKMVDGYDPIFKVKEI